LLSVFQVVVNEETAHETEQFLNKRLQAIKNQRTSGDNEDLALIIGGFLFVCLSRSSLTTRNTDGKSLTFALEKELSMVFLELALMCKVGFYPVCRGPIIARLN
jgi:phospholipid-transporting ATPase